MRRACDAGCRCWCCWPCLAGAVTGTLAIALVTEVLRQAEAGVALPGLGVVRAPAGVGDAVLALLMLVVLLLRPSGVVTLLGHKRGAG